MATPSIQETKTVVVPSFTDENVTYVTDPESCACTCKRYRYTGTCIKHVVYAEAAVRLSKRTSFLPGWDLARLYEVCQKLFSPISDEETIRDSYDLAIEVGYSMFSTQRMRVLAMRRHQRVLAMSGHGGVHAV